LQCRVRHSTGDARSEAEDSHHPESEVVVTYVPDDPEYPAPMFEQFVGRTVQSIEQSREVDEGLTIVFTDGSRLIFGFSGCEGFILGKERE
jgi:hypothetical protein